jgi:hypothetical protein
MLVKFNSFLAIITLALIIWFIGWAWNTFIGLPKLLADFVTGFGLIATVGFVFTAIKELGE